MGPVRLLSVRWLEITKRALFGGYNYTSEYLFKTKMTDSCAVVVYKPNYLYPHNFCISQKPIAFGGQEIITICIMNPIDGLYTIHRPKFSEKQLVPYMD